MPISSTAIVHRLCEYIFHSAILTHLANNIFLSDAQHGFRIGRSCDTQHFLALVDIYIGLNDNQNGLMLLDFAKAFEKVFYHALL